MVVFLSQLPCMYRYKEEEEDDNDDDDIWIGNKTYQEEEGFLESEDGDLGRELESEEWFWKSGFQAK